MVDDIRKWLDELGLEKYGDVFVENEVSVRDLPGISNDDLKELGLPLGPRRRVLIATETLNDPSSNVAASSDTAPDDVDPSPSPSTAQAERRQLTVMFCDLVGSTALSQQLDPEDLREVMRRYQDAVAGAVTRYQGHVAKFLGDGVLAYFGWPRAHEDQAEQAIRAGLAAVAAVQAVRLGGNAFITPPPARTFFIRVFVWHVPPFRGRNPGEGRPAPLRRLRPAEHLRGQAA